MVDRQIGRERFLAALRARRGHAPVPRRVLERFRGRLRAGRPDFADQWLTRTGAPALALDGREVLAGRPCRSVCGRASRSTRCTCRWWSPPPGAPESEHVVTLDSAGGILHASGRRRHAAGRGSRLPAVPPSGSGRDRADHQPGVRSATATPSSAGAKAGPLASAALGFARAFAENDSCRGPGRRLAGGRPYRGADQPGTGAAGAVPGAGADRGGPHLLPGRPPLQSGRPPTWSMPRPTPGVPVPPPWWSCAGRRTGCRAWPTACPTTGSTAGWLCPPGQGRPERGNWAPGASPLLAVR